MATVNNNLISKCFLALETDDGEKALLLLFSSQVRSC